MPDKVNSIPEEGKKAPAFTMEGHSSGKVQLTKLTGQWVVLYFYPKDDTPGCTVEANEFKALNTKFKKENALIFGVSPDDIDSHCKFVNKFKLNFELLADKDHKIAEKYGVWVEKSMYGKKYMGIQRSTFLIDPKGKMAKVWPKVTPKGHAEEVLSTIKELAKG